MATLLEAQHDYINRWKQNSLQHFNDGDYDWVARLVEKTGAKRIMEIGCGAGHSTLALINRGMQILSVDPIPEAINETKKLMSSYGITVGTLDAPEKNGLILMVGDVIEDYERIAEYADLIDLVLICNPGGKITDNLTQNELKILHSGGYSDEQMKEEQIPALHKWAVLLASAKLAYEHKKKLIIVDRGTPEEVDQILNVIPIAMGVKGVGKTCRQINQAPQAGIQLNGEGESVFWGAGYYVTD